MRRRTVIAGLAALCLAPQRSSAQQSQGKIPRVGILTAADTERTRSLDAFRQGLRDLGRAATLFSNFVSRTATTLFFHS